MDRVERSRWGRWGRWVGASAAPGPGFRGRPGSVLLLVVACGVVVCMLVLMRGQRPPPDDAGRSDPGTVLTAAGESLLRAPGAVDAVDLRSLVGEQVEVRAVMVLSAPNGDGFWIGTDDDRLWVELTGPDTSVYPADGALTVDLDAVVVASTAALLAAVGLMDADGAARLERSGAYLVADRAAVRAVVPD